MPPRLVTAFVFCTWLYCSLYQSINCLENYDLEREFAVILRVLKITFTKREMKEKIVEDTIVDIKDSSES